MPFRLASFALVLVAVFLLVTGNGILSTLIPFRAKIETFPDLIIGCIGSSFYAGMLGGAVVAPGLVRRFGPIGGFAFCSFAGAAATLLMPLLIEPFLWVGFRFLIGFSLTGLYAIVESWLSGASDDMSRGRVLGVCSLAQYAAWAAGSFTFTLADPGKFLLFGLAGALLGVSALPLVLVREKPPVRPAKSSIDLVWFFKVAPAAFLGALLIGLANGPLYSLSPVFGAEAGLSAVDVGMMMTAFTIGSAAFQIPNGWLSDRFDRRRLLMLLALVSALFEVVLGGFGARMPAFAILATALVIGASDAAQYYVAAAHAVDRCGRAEAVMAMAAMIVLYGIGAIAGPPAASAVMSMAGASALYLFQAVAHLTLAAWVMHQVFSARPRTASADQAP